MTLPPNCLPPDNASLAGDMLAVLTPPAGNAETAGANAAPFATLLADAAPANAPVAPAPLDARSQPAGVPLPALYPGICYTNLLPSASPENAAGEVESPAEEPDQSDLAPAPATNDENALLLAFQFIAGQWVPQPVTPPTEEIRCSGDASGAGFGQTQALPAGLAAREAALLNKENLPATSGAPAATPAQPATPATPNNKLSTTAKTAPAAASLDPKSEPAATPAVPAMPATASLKADSATPVTPVPNLTQATPEKFAAPGSETRAETASGVNSPNGSLKKETLVADAKAVKSSPRQVGTGAANREYSMPYFAANKPSAPSITALPQSAPTGGMQNSTTASVAEVDATASAQAPRLVREIHAIADRISTIDRNTVEVHFDFNESDRLNVRVEYRDGTVHTTFRTDSDTLRNAIAREWQAQAPAPEARAYRVAEPVFSANSASSSVDLSQSGLGSGQSNSRTFEQHASSGHAGHSHHGRSAGGASSGTASAPATTARPETSLHLHTFA